MQKKREPTVAQRVKAFFAEPSNKCSAAALSLNTLALLFMLNSPPEVRAELAEAIYRAIFKAWGRCRPRGKPFQPATAYKKIIDAHVGLISEIEGASVSINQTIRRVAEFSWPEEGISTGDVLIVRKGEATEGQLITLIYRDSLIVNKLLKRLDDGAIEVVGPSGKHHPLAVGEYKLEGAVIDIQKGQQAAAQRAERKQKDSSEEIEELKEKISKLDYEPENEACYFKLQTELWNLEHPAEEDDSVLDAEYISGRGFTNREGSVH